jgi:hypothetical protein
MYEGTVELGEIGLWADTENSMSSCGNVPLPAILAQGQ